MCSIDTLYLDYDETLINTMENWLLWINKSHSTSFILSDISTWGWFYELEKSVFDWFDTNIYKNDEVMPFHGAVDFVKRVGFRTHTKILTATHEERLVTEKNDHIKRHFGDIETIHHHNKSDYAQSKRNGKVNVIIDDKPQTCEEWVEKGGVAILFNYGDRNIYSNTHFKDDNLYTATSYQEVIRILSIFNPILEKETVSG